VCPTERSSWSWDVKDTRRTQHSSLAKTTTDSPARAASMRGMRHAKRLKNSTVPGLTHPGRAKDMQIRVRHRRLTGPTSLESVPDASGNERIVPDC
jgi:hypothetical protein